MVCYLTLIFWTDWGTKKIFFTLHIRQQTAGADAVDDRRSDNASQPDYSLDLDLPLRCLCLRPFCCYAAQFDVPSDFENSFQQNYELIDCSEPHQCCLKNNTVCHCHIVFYMYCILSSGWSPDFACRKSTGINSVLVFKFLQRNPVFV